VLACNDSKFYVADKKPIHSLAKTGSFLVPSSITKMIQSGMELGDADDKVFGRVDSKSGQGTVGYLTNGMIDRSSYYEHAVTLALVPWIRPDIYGSGATSSGLFCSSGH
jgi:inosine/xanthosine triphosphatase